MQEAQARRNAASSGIGQAKAAKDEARAKALMEEVAQLKVAIRDGEAKEREDDKAFQDYLAAIPNVPADDVPVGDETANKELRKVGTPRDIQTSSPSSISSLARRSASWISRPRRSCQAPASWC